MDPVSASFGKVTAGRPTSFSITLNNPTGSNQIFAISVSKFTPDPSLAIYNGGTITSGDNRITVPPSVTVPANGSTTLTVTVNAGQPQGTIVQGWINLDGPGTNDLHFAYYAQVGR
jgi:hypothetical protein